MKNSYFIKVSLGLLIFGVGMALGSAITVRVPAAPVAAPTVGDDAWNADEARRVAFQTLTTLQAIRSDAHRAAAKVDPRPGD